MLDAECPTHRRKGNHCRHGKGPYQCDDDCNVACSVWVDACKREETKVVQNESGVPIPSNIHPAHDGPCPVEAIVPDTRVPETRKGPPDRRQSENPKNIAGADRASLTKVSPIALLYCADAMMDGAGKYGPFNWREKNISAYGYVDAAMRHLLYWWEGQERATDSGAHHLGHAMASCAILIDAQAHACLIDDRPKSDGGVAFAKALAIVKQNETMRAEARRKKITEAMAGQPVTPSIPLPKRSG